MNATAHPMSQTARTDAQMTDREQATHARAELRGVAVLNLRELGHDSTDPDLIAAEMHRLMVANEMAERGCLRELA
ncbi:hypothetical protein K0U83_03790 [bacterium]|nr:hypothetical protein [bacterium]